MSRFADEMKELLRFGDSTDEIGFVVESNERVVELVANMIGSFSIAVKFYLISARIIMPADSN
jgi:hypothetical protein